jgi:hypothetical protein
LKTIVLLIGQSNINLLDTDLKELADHPSVQIEILTDEDFANMIEDIQIESEDSIL